MLLKLTNCEESAIIDEEDYAELSKWRWRKSGTGYVIRTINTKAVFIQHAIMGRREGLFVDHINRNKLDNRRENLRFCTPAQNQTNRIYPNETGYRGVYKCKRCKSKWEIRVTNREHKYVFRFGFNSALEAAKAYNELALAEQGEFAILNDV